MSRGAAVVQFRNDVIRAAWRRARRSMTAIDFSLARTPTPSLSSRVTNNLNYISGANRRSWNMLEGGIATDRQMPQLYCS
jgi:hypothetical protein